MLTRTWLQGETILKDFSEYIAACNELGNCTLLEKGSFDTKSDKPLKQFLDGVHRGDRVSCRSGGFIGDPGRSPTCDLRVRSALLYATELPGHLAQCIAGPVVN